SKASKISSLIPDASSIIISIFSICRPLAASFVFAVRGTAHQFLPCSLRYIFFSVCSNKSLTSDLFNHKAISGQRALDKVGAVGALHTTFGSEKQHINHITAKLTAAVLPTPRPDFTDTLSLFCIANKNS